MQVLASTEETEEFLALAAGPGPVAGVVGWADLISPAVGDEIARLRALPGGGRLAGIRHLCTLAVGNAEVAALARDALAALLGRTELDAVFRANAIDVYRLGGGRTTRSGP